MVQYVEGYSVVYGETPSDEPQDAVKEIEGASNDFNEKFKGKYVWIRPKYTSAQDFAIGGLSVVTSRDALPDMSDLAMGAGGLYRYLVKKESSGKVTKLGLLRSGSSHTSPPVGWDGISTDFNVDRGGAYLYVVWQFH